MIQLETLRKKKGISMRKAASLLKMPYTTYISYEKGVREPNSETLIRLAEFFDCTIDYLVGHSEDEKPIIEIEHDEEFAKYIEGYNDPTIRATYAMLQEATPEHRTACHEAIIALLKALNDK